MFIRTKDNVEGVHWGNGHSYRLLVERDGLGFGFAHTVVAAGTESRLQYTRHVEACYCIFGRGSIASADETEEHELVPGTLYALDNHDAHYLRAADGEDMHLISVFDPPITGAERHTLSSDGFSSY